MRIARGEQLTQDDVEGRWREFKPVLNREVGKLRRWKLGESGDGNERVIKREIGKDEVMDVLKKMNTGRTAIMDGIVLEM